MGIDFDINEIEYDYEIDFDTFNNDYYTVNLKDDDDIKYSLRSTYDCSLYDARNYGSIIISPNTRGDDDLDQPTHYVDTIRIPGSDYYLTLDMPKEKIEKLEEIMIIYGYDNSESSWDYIGEDKTIDELIAIQKNVVEELLNSGIAVCQ